ncbi:hypothetical protein PVK06_034154 [Gossypium arboreum]|uniref:Ionotropic glutamate receptor C-terminal domain-containing protein n=1 Tax=Gossypium arboreum TaxID=29729 RepID=A0ABR0NDF8_GOSAR|nr:hypothetical protein PVK06_034154 [Gossypium arboreum]
MDNFSTKVPTPCGESALPKAKLESASSVLSMIRKTSRKKVNCFSALISSFKDLKFHRNDIDTVTLNLSSLAAHSRNHKLWGSVEVVEASLSTTSTLPLQWTFFDDIRGFSVDVIEAVVRLLPYQITYKFTHFDGSSDELINKVAYETFDVAIGDIVTTGGHKQHVVKAKTNELNNFWWLLTTFTPQLWVMIATFYHLVKVLGFKRRNIRTIASMNDYEEALSSGSIKDAFLLTPYAKVFLAKHCAHFTEIKSTHHDNLGGFGFVFSKGSHLAHDISAAILELEESGELRQMEEEMWGFFYCERKLLETSMIQTVRASPFHGLFLLSGVNTKALLQSPKGETLLIETAPLSSHTTIPRTIEWHEINLPDRWKLEGATGPVAPSPIRNTSLSEISQH